jgi:hypothetical protein
VVEEADGDLMGDGVNIVATGVVSDGQRRSTTARFVRPSI